MIYYQIKKILDNIIKTTEKDMWIKELDDLEINYNKWVEQIDKEIPITKTKKKIIFKKHI